MLYSFKTSEYWILTTSEIQSISFVVSKLTIRRSRQVSFSAFCRLSVPDFAVCCFLHLVSSEFSWALHCHAVNGNRVPSQSSRRFASILPTAPLLTVALCHYEAKSQIATHTQPQVQEPSAQGFIQPPRRGEYSPLKQMSSPLREDHQLPPHGRSTCVVIVAPLF